MTTRQFLYLDTSLNTPPDVTTVPEGYSMFTNDGHLHLVQMGSWVDLTPAGATPGVPVLAVTASLTLDPSMAGKVLEVDSSSPVTLTLAAGLVPVGGQFMVQIDQLGTGTVSISAPGGTSLNGGQAFKSLTGRYASATLRKTLSSGDDFILVGQFS